MQMHKAILLLDKKEKEETPTHKSVKCVEVSCLHYAPSQGVIASAYIPETPWFAYFSA
jgi:hypothetical protein